MAQICSHVSWNGEKSVLAQQLTDKYQDPALTDRLMYYVYSDDFIVKYGDWKADNTKVQLDDVAKEPTLEWVEQELSMQLPAKSKVYTDTKAIVLSEPTSRVRKADRVGKDELVKRIRQELIAPAVQNSDVLYMLNYNDLSSRYAQNSGYTLREYAEILDTMREELPENLKFTPVFKSAMDNNPGKISRNIEKLIEDQDSRLPINLDPEMLARQQARMTVPLVDAKGKSIGFFDEVDQEEAEQTVLNAVYTSLVRSPNEPVVKVLHRVLYFFQRAETKQGNTDILKNKLSNIVKSFAFNHKDERPSFTSKMFDALKQLGYNIDTGNRNRILDYLDKYKGIYEAPNETVNYSGIDNTKVSDGIEENVDENFEELYENTFATDASLGRGADDWSSVSFEIDQRDTASTRMKVFMSTIERSMNTRYKSATAKEGALDVSNLKSVQEITPAIAQQANGKDIWHDNKQLESQIVNYLQQEYPVLPYRNSLGLPELSDFDSMFELAMNKLANQSDKTIDNYVALLKDSGNPGLRALANKLTGKLPGKPATNADKQLQNEFVKVFSKQYNPFLTVLAKTKIDDRGREYTDIRLINAQRGSQVQTIVKEWQEANKLSDMMILREDGSRVMDVKRAREKHIPVIQAYNIIANVLPSVTSNEDIKNASERAEALLKPIKWPYSIQDTIKDFRGSRQLLKAHFQKMFGLYGINLNSDMLDGILDSGKLEKLTKGTKREGNLNQAFSITKEGKPNGLLSIFFMKAAGLNNDVDIDEADMEEGIEQATLNNPLWTESTSVNALAKVAANYTEALFSSTHKSIEGKKIWDFSQNTALSKRVQLLKNNFEETVQDYNDTDLISKDGTVSDGSFYLRHWTSNPKDWKDFNLYYLEGMNYNNKNSGVTRQQMSDREQLLTSIAAFQNANRPVGHFISLTHSDKTMTPVGYNVPKIETGVTILEKAVIDELRQIFYAEHRRISLQKDSSGDRVYDEGKKHFYFLPQFNRDLMKDPSKLWNADGTIKPSVDGFKQILDAELVQFVKDLTDNSIKVWNDNSISVKLFDKKLVNSYNKVLDKNLSPEEKDRIIFEAEARKYAVNHFIWNTNLSMLFFGDPAQEWKGSIPATMVEYAKRLAKDIAPGQDLAFEKGSIYNAVTLKDVKVSDKYITELGIKNNSNGTDAQELTTVQEHLDVMYAAGLVTPAKYNELSKVASESGEFTPQQLDIVLQPMKPVYAGFRRAINGVMLYDYIKSSSYPLIPQFTKGLEVDKLRKWMEDNNVQRANFESAKKIGQPAYVASVFTADGHWKDDLQVRQSVQTLSRDGFRIQQDVPYDEEKEAIKIVSQMNKLIVEGLNDIDTQFELPGDKIMKPAELRAYKEDIRKKMLDKSMQKLTQKLGIKQLADGSYSGFDLYKISKVLQEEAEARGYSKNEVEVLRYLTEDGRFEVPIFLHPSVEKFESLLMSMVRKASETKMPGKSYVQASSVGYVKSQLKKDGEVDKTNIVWVGDYDGRTPLRHQQLVDGKVIPAQVIMPFNFFYADGTKARIEDFVLEESGRKTIDFERIPRELLQLIGARIPNQGHSSTIAIEIVGFTHEKMGDIIIIPSAVTGQMGSDFDVDKLYTYKRPYKHTAEGFRQEDEVLESAYFDVHWSVLTNKDVYSKILNPLDKDDLKDMNKKFKVKSTGFYNYFDVVSQLSDFQSGKDAKALVGLTSLSVTFNSVLQDKDVRLGSYQWNEETGEMEEVEDAIEVEYNDERLKLNTISGNGKNLYNGEVRTKHDNHTTIQSGAVDNAKDKTLDSLNIGIATYPAIAALHQLQTTNGKIVGVDLSTALTVQPIIWEFSREMRQGNDSLSEEFVPNLKAAVIEKLKEKYKNLAGELKMDFIMSPERLSKEWNKSQNGTTPENSPEFAATQLAILNIFEKLHNYGERLSVLQKTFNQDTNGAGPSILYTLQQQDNYNNLTSRSATKVFLGEGTISNNGQTEQGYFFEKLIPFTRELASQLFPISAMYNGINAVVQQTGKLPTDIPLRQQREIVRSIRSYTMTATSIFGTNPDVERVRLLNTTSKSKSLAIRVEEAKAKDKSNYFLQRLSTNINILGNGPDFVNYENAKTIRLDDEKNVTAFMNMLVSPDKETRILAEDLVRYTYLLNPQNGPTSFIKHIPTSYLVATDFAKDMQIAIDALSDHTSNEVFATQLYQHNPSLALEIKADAFAEYLQEGQDFAEWFMIEDGTRPSLIVPYTEQDGTASEKYTDFVRYFSKKYGQNILYKKKSQGTHVVYQRIDTLGKGDKTEYNANTTAQVRSIFPENRAAVEWTPSISVQQALTNQVDRMIGTSDNKSNQYANWGLPAKGTMKDANRALKEMAKDRALPQYLRTVAEMIRSSSQTIEESDAMTMAGLKPQAFTIEVSPAMVELGSYTPSQNKLMLKPNANKTVAAETFLHEMSHQRTSAIASTLGYVDDKYMKRFPEPVRKQIEQEIEKMSAAYNKKYPGIAEKFRRLDAIRYQALQELNKRVTRDGYDMKQIISDLDNRISNSRNHQLYYGLSNMQEFLAHVWTNKEVMSFLNEIDSTENKTFVQQIWELLTDILTQVGAFLGTKVSEKGLLKEALTLTLHINNLQATESLGITIGKPGTAIVLTESKADQMKDVMENSYDQEVNKKNNRTHWMLGITNNRLPTSSNVTLTDTASKLIKKMELQVASLNKILSTRVVTPEDKKRRIKIEAMRKEIQQDIEEMTQQRDLMAITQIGEKQLEWVKQIIEKPEPAIQEMILASNLLDMWTEVNNTIYDKDMEVVNLEFKKLINELQGNATDIANTLIRAREKAILNLARDKGSRLEPADLNKNLKAASGAAMYTITLSRDRNAAVQLLTSIGQEAANNSDEEQNRLKTRLGALEAKIQAVAGSKKNVDKVWNKFIQESDDGKSFGLVQPLSVDWYRSTSKARYALTNDIRKINTRTSTSVDPKSKLAFNEAKREDKRAAFEKYWKSINESSTVVDILKLVNPETGERTEDESYQKEYNRLVEVAGDKDIVDKTIDKAVEEYQEYIEHKLTAFEAYDELELTPEETDVLQLSSEQLGTMDEADQAKELSRLQKDALAAKIEKEKARWITRNSPASFVSTQVQGMGDSKFNHNLEFLPQFVPRKADKWFDKKYKDIQADPRLTEIYNEFVAMSETFRDYLPPNESNRLRDNFLPVVSKEDVNNFYQMLSKFSASEAGQKLLNKFTVSEYDKSRVDAEDIPLNFIHRGNKEVEDLSRNLPKIFEMFGNMAIHYKNMRPVQEVVEVIERLVQDVDAQRRLGNEEESLKHLSESIKFYKDMLVFKKPKKLEMVSENAIYDINPVKDKKIKQRITEIKKKLDGLEDNIDDLLDEEGNIKESNNALEREALEAELKGYEEKARYLTGSKAADVMIGINQLKALSFNPFSAVNNLTFGLISGFIHSYGRADYAPKDYRWGLKKMRGSIARSYTMNSVEVGDSKKIRSIMDRIGVISEIMETMYGKSNLASQQKSGFRKVIDPFGWQKSGDYLTKGAMVLAMMRTKQVEVEVDGEKKKISLYDAIGENGEWDVEKYGENKLWSSENIEDQKEWNKFRDKSRKVSTIVFGNQDKNQPLLAKKYMLGRLMGQFRLSWLPEGINTRWGKEYYDEQLGRYVKGRWRTMKELGIHGSIKTLLKQTMSVFTKSDPFAGSLKKDGTELSEVDRENMRKNIAGITYTMVIAAAMMSLKMMMPNEEEKRRRRRKGKDGVNVNMLAFNMLTRSYQDLALYSSPAVFDQVLGNVIPSMNVPMDIGKAIKALATRPFQDYDSEKKEEKATKSAVKKVMRAIPIVNLIPKIQYMSERDLSTIAR